MTAHPDTDLAEAVGRAVHDRTGGWLRNATVTVTHEVVLVCGIAPSFYVKQMALEAARSALRGRQLCIRLEITVHGRQQH
jgi:hypothetical protein